MASIFSNCSIPACVRPDQIVSVSVLSEFGRVHAKHFPYGVAYISADYGNRSCISLDRRDNIDLF
jgi:hypothetical protein